MDVENSVENVEKPWKQRWKGKERQTGPGNKKVYMEKIDKTFT